MKKLSIEVPDNLHPATAKAVQKFATAMASKLYKSQRRYGYTDDWRRSDITDLQLDLNDHFEKGDPIDVANFCMFLWSRKAKVNE